MAREGRGTEYGKIDIQEKFERAKENGEELLIHYGTSSVCLNSYTNEATTTAKHSELNKRITDLFNQHASSNENFYIRGIYNTAKEFSYCEENTETERANKIISNLKQKDEKLR